MQRISSAQVERTLQTAAFCAYTYSGENMTVFEWTPICHVPYGRFRLLIYLKKCLTCYAMGTPWRLVQNHQGY